VSGNIRTSQTRSNNAIPNDPRSLLPRIRTAWAIRPAERQGSGDFSFLIEGIEMEKVSLQVERDDGSKLHINTNHIVSWKFINHCVTIETIRGEHQIKGKNVATVVEWLSQFDIG
jgi:hypothetical protein